jgi:hypothetical protein
MPKTSNTRKQRAAELLKKLTNGPAFDETPGRPLSLDEIKSQYRIWSESWILDELKELVPELRERNNP